MRIKAVIISLAIGLHGCAASPGHLHSKDGSSHLATTTTFGLAGTPEMVELAGKAFAGSNISVKTIHGLTAQKDYFDPAALHTASVEELIDSNQKLKDSVRELGQREGVPAIVFFDGRETIIEMPSETETKVNVGNVVVDTLDTMVTVALSVFGGYTRVSGPLSGNWTSQQVTGGGPCQGIMATAYVIENGEPTMVVRHQNCNLNDRTPMVAVVEEIVKERIGTKQ